MTMARIVRTDGKPMVRIIRTDGKPTHHVDPLSLANTCGYAKRGMFGFDGYYQAAFVEPAPLFQAVTYSRASGPENGHLVGGPVPLAEALTTAAEERIYDERSGIGHRWRTVVRAAR